MRYPSIDVMHMMILRFTLKALCSGAMTALRKERFRSKYVT